jgi:hypothetical protein
VALSGPAARHRVGSRSFCYQIKVSFLLPNSSRRVSSAFPSAFSRTCAQRHAGAPIATGTGVGLPPASSVLSALQILSLSVVSCGVLEARDSLVTLEDAATYMQATQAVGARQGADAARHRAQRFGWRGGARGAAAEQAATRRGPCRIATRKCNQQRRPRGNFGAAGRNGAPKLPRLSRRKGRRPHSWAALWCRWLEKATRCLFLQHANGVCKSREEKVVICNSLVDPARRVQSRTRSPALREGTASGCGL